MSYEAAGLVFRVVVGGVVAGGVPMLLQGDIYHAGPIIRRGITSQPVMTGLSPEDCCALDSALLSRCCCSQWFCSDSAACTATKTTAVGFSVL